MTARPIENPVLNSPFQEPRRHFHLDDQGITSDIVQGLRPGSYSAPLPKAQRRGGQLALAAKRAQEL